jgi:hypothetical protein
LGGIRLNEHFSEKAAYHNSAAGATVSPVKSARMRLDILLRAERLTPEEHHKLCALLRTVDGCDVEECHLEDELVIQLTREVSAQSGRFSDAKLEQLASLV